MQRRGGDLCGRGGEVSGPLYLHTASSLHTQEVESPSGYEVGPAVARGKGLGRPRRRRPTLAQLRAGSSLVHPEFLSPEELYEYARLNEQFDVSVF